MTKFLALKSIASVNSGYPFKRAIEPSGSGRIKVAQAKDIQPKSLVLNPELLTRIDDEIPRSGSFIRQNDVLLVSRGAGSHKVAIVKFCEANILASASLYIIRVSDRNILPEYLAVYLNSETGQNKLSKITTGAYIQNITRNNLEELSIPVPSILQQRSLVELQKNIWQQETILTRKIQLKKCLMNVTINNIIKR